MELCKDVVAAPSLRGMSEDEIRRMVCESEADTIIHTAAISDMGACEADPDGSFHANVEIPIFLVLSSEGKKLICFSSDQVYNGLEDEGPYTEEKVKPANTYAMHKMEMEQRVLDICPDAVMLRAEWMYDYYLKKPNYFMNLIGVNEKVSFSSKQYRGITYVKEVAENMEKVISMPGGVYNFGSETTKNMYEVTRQFIDELGLDIQIEDVPERHNLWMNCSKAKKYGVIFCEVSEALMKCAKDNGFKVKNDLEKASKDLYDLVR